MLETRVQRVVAVALLLTALAGLTVQFGALDPNPRLGHYPTGDHIAADYERYVDEQVRVSGTVASVDPLVLAVAYEARVGGEYRTGTAEFRVDGVSKRVTPGQLLSVYGTAERDRTISATDAVVVPARNQLYMYAVSFIAGLWVLARIARGWTVAWDEFALRRRSQPLPVADVVMQHFRTGEPTDA
jgi:hypothetical protein